ncbi:MAG: hypothetical protein AAF927_02040 [Bacteroidota bacterium]
MGLDTNGVKFLLDAKGAGVSFAKSAMIGRQFLYLDQSELQACFKLLGETLSANEAKAIIEEYNGYAEQLLYQVGADAVDSFDASDYESASVIHDFNQPIGQEHKGKYTMVLDGGTLEHIFHFPNAIQNCMEMLEVGGHFLSITPTNNMFGHGFYQFCPELFYRIFSIENGFEIEEIITFINEPNSAWYKVSDPQIVKKRVKLINNRETYLLVRAKKVQSVPVLVKPPQQSDYVINYWDPEQERSELKPSMARRVINNLPKPLGSFISNFAQLFRKTSLQKELGIANPLYFKKKNL